MQPAGFSVIAVVIIGVAALSNASGAAHITGWEMLPLGLPLVILGYFIAGTLGGVAFWMLWPARSWLGGWMLTGFVIAALLYGAIGITGIFSYQVGANILNLESAAEGWRMLPWIALITGVLPGSILGVCYWYKERKGEQLPALQRPGVCLDQSGEEETTATRRVQLVAPARAP